MPAAVKADKPNVRTATAEAADAKAEVIEVEIPEGLDLKLPGDEVVAEEAETTGEPETTPEPKRAEKKQDRLPASTREERNKRKELAKKYDEATAERDRLEAELRARRGQPQIGMSKEHREALIERGNKADSMGQLVEIFLDEQGKRDQFWAAALDEERFNRHLQVSETIARKDFDAQHGRGAYDRVLREAGIKDAIALEANGQFRDPSIARAIYTKQDPGLEALELALGKLEKDGRLDAALRSASKAPTADPDTEVEVEEEPEPKSRARRAESEEDPAADKRAGAREVIDQVRGNSSRPRGLHAVKPSPPPRRGLTMADIDGMSDANRSALFKVNPGLRERWLGGEPEAQ